VFLILSVVFGGLVIGALGRLLVPGPTPIGCLGTIVVGILGSVIGWAIARAIYRYPENHRIITLLLEVGAAAVLVSILTGGRRRRYW
jgi:uncharacterized membrane protein YeaQ/YmgE (transglycosylase-associated protein family)